MFDYSTSILNPALKVVVAVGYIAVIYFYFQCLREYQGSKTGTAVQMLLLMGIFGLLAATARYFGHGTDFGFSKEFSLKWFQSLFYICQAVFFIFAASYFWKSAKT